MSKTFAAEIEAVAAGLPILGVVIGVGDYDQPYDRAVPKEKRGVLLTWDDARSLLDYEWDSSFGGADCHPIYAWTAERVIFVHEYDGSTRVNWLPVSPVAVDPEFDGDY